MRGYNVKATLNDGLNEQECKDVLDKVRKVRGVLTANFTEAAAKKEIFVQANLPGNLVDEHERSIDESLSKIPGVKAVIPSYTLLKSDSRNENTKTAPRKGGCFALIYEHYLGYY